MDRELLELVARANRARLVGSAEIEAARTLRTLSRADRDALQEANLASVRMRHAVRAKEAILCAQPGSWQAEGPALSSMPAAGTAPLQALAKMPDTPPGMHS